MTDTLFPNRSKIIRPEPQPSQPVVDQSKPFCPFTTFTIPVVKQSSIKTAQPEVGIDVRMMPCVGASCMLFNREEGACMIWVLSFQLNEVVDGLDALNAATVPAGEEASAADGGVNAGGTVGDIPK